MNCKPWSNYLRPDGYGQVNYMGRTTRAHRLAFVQANGLSLADIAGKLVRHTCDNPSCVNPEHLVLGSNLDNARDRVSRNRGARGERQGSAKLSATRVAEIRALLLANVPQREIARRFGVAQSQVCCIKSGKTWRHV